MVSTEIFPRVVKMERGGGGRVRNVNEDGMWRDKNDRQSFVFAFAFAAKIYGEFCHPFPQSLGDNIK